MHRNLDRRVEALVRINDPGHIAELGELLELSMRPRTRRPGTSGRTASGPATPSDPDGEPLRDLQAPSDRHPPRRRPAAAAEPLSPA